MRDEKSLRRREQTRISGLSRDIYYCDPRNAIIASVWKIIRDYQRLHVYQCLREFSWDCTSKDLERNLKNIFKLSYYYLLDSLKILS